MRKFLSCTVELFITISSEVNQWGGKSIQGEYISLPKFLKFLYTSSLDKDSAKVYKK